MTAVESKINKWRYGVKRLERDNAWRLGLGRAAFRKARGKRIVLYHGICEDDHLRFNTLFITRRMFEDHLKLYKQYATVISMDDYYNDDYDPGRFAICLAFDDGFANNYRYVLPLLEQYQVPAAFFITAIREAGYDILWNDMLSIASKLGPGQVSFNGTGYAKDRHGRYVSIGGEQLLADVLRGTGFELKAEWIKSAAYLKEKADPDYWRQLDVAEIRAMAVSPWVKIGSHGYFHNDLAKISPGEARKELTGSKSFLENITGKPINAMAFPYGSYSKEVLQLAREAGYNQLLATRFLFPDDQEDATLRERFTINPFISPVNQMHANIYGHYR